MEYENYQFGEIRKQKQNKTNKQTKQKTTKQ